MTDFEQRAVIKFLVKLNKSDVEIRKMLEEAYGESASKKTCVNKWGQRFCEGRQSLQDDERSGRPSTSTTGEKIEEVERLMNTDRRLTVAEVAAECDISFGSAQSILTEKLHMRRVAAKMVPRLLTADQKERRMVAAIEILEMLGENPELLENVVTGDETWVYGYDPETKLQSSQWKKPNEPRPKKARQCRMTGVKVMLITFFDCKGIIHYEFVPRGTTVTGLWYRDLLKRVKKAYKRKREGNEFILHHDNAPSHSSFVVQQYLTKKKIAILPQPPYSPDVSPCDFWLFPRLKMPLKGKRFQTVEEIEENVREALRGFDEAFFRRCFEQWKERWRRCINAGGEYFEGD